MSSTYLELVNKIARQYNEVELTSANFPDAIGVYNAMKDGVQFAINHINAQDFEWPFNFVEGQTQLLAVGDNFYDFPADFKIVDWNSFYIVKDDSLGVNTSTLRVINKDEFHRTTKPSDFDAGSDGRSVPRFVFPWGNQAFGITPSPDKAYTVTYNYWKNPDQLSTYDDTTNIPVQFDHVIVLGAMWYLHMFKENANGTQLGQKQYMDALKTMRTILINKPERMTDTRVNFGQRHYSNDYVDEG